MENATKALLMAAGILITIVVLSLAIFVYGRVSDYYQTKQRNISQEQIAAFNNEYTVYNRDDVTGFETVSLINKAIDFNQNLVYGANNTGESDERLGLGYTEMKIDIKLYSPKNYYGDYNDFKSMALFQSNEKYEYTGKNSGSRRDLETKIKNMQKLENTYNYGDLVKLTSCVTELKNNEQTVEDITGKKYSIDLASIVQYADYLTFKRGTYKCTKMEYDKYGQICYLEFEQTK